MESPDTDSAPDTSSDAITSTTSTTTSKKKSKKKNQGSDFALFLAFPFIVIAIFASLFSILSFIQIEPIAWFAESCASLRAQYVLILMFCIVPVMFAPMKIRLPTAIGCGVFALINFCFVFSCLLPPKEITKEVKDLVYLRFRVMQFSIPDRETKLDSLLNEVARTKPDVVCLTGAPLQQLWDLSAKMPPEYIHRTQLPWDGNCYAIFSRQPLKDVKIKKIGPEKLPVMVAGLQFDYGWCRLILVKMPEPSDNDTLESRNEHLKAVAELARKTPGREIVVGTFNTTPYSMAFSDFLKTSELLDTRMGNGLQPNWHLFNFDVFFLRMPVDHIFVDPRLVTLGRYVCASVDNLQHKPLIVDLCPADQNKEPEYKGEDDPPEPVKTQPKAPEPEQKTAPKTDKKAPATKPKKRAK